MQPSTMVPAARHLGPTERVLAEAMAHDPQLTLIGEGVSHGEWPQDRSFTVPIADRGALGLALGMALAGRRVVVTLADASRLMAGAEVLTEAAALARAGEFSVTMVVRAPWRPETALGSWLVDEAGPRVVVPGTPDAVAGLLKGVLQSEGPTILLEPVGVAPRGGEVQALPPQARLLRTGQHATVVAVGTSVATALEAAEVLASGGISVDVIDLVCLSPMDRGLLGARARHTGRLLVATDDPAISARVREVAVDEAFLYFEAPLATVCPGVDLIVAGVREAVAY